MATGTHITKTPGILGGKARLKQRRISVADIVEHLQCGESVTEVAERLQIDTEEVEAARDYWQEHPDEIADQLEARDELYAELLSSSQAPGS